MDLIETQGCPLVVERGNRVFPKSNKSSDIIKAFTQLLQKHTVNIILNQHISDLIIQDNICKGIIVNKNPIEYDAVILCSGGISYPSTGSDGSGYLIAKKAGHKIIEPLPALVGIVLKEDWPKLIAGLTLKNVELSLYDQKKLVFKELGECLFTHSGISGPIALSASSYIQKPYNNFKIYLDLKPGLTLEKLDDRIQRDFKENLNKDFKNSLNKLLPKNLIPIILDYSGIKKTQKVNSITKEQRFNLGKLIKALPLEIAGLAPIESAIITRGGVDTKEINPNTMESKLIKNLYFAGEIIDVDALTGGYNIQIACSTGYLAGLSVNSNKDES